MALFPAGQDLLGKKASDLVGEDLCVYEDGTVEGTLKAVTGYTGFSSEEEEQSGHYFPFKLTKTGKKMSLKKNGVAAEGKENMTFDPEIILRVSKEDTWKIEVDESEVITFNFEKAVLEYVAGGDDVGAGKTDYRNTAGLSDPAVFSGYRINEIPGRGKSKIGFFESRTKSG